MLVRLLENIDRQRFEPYVISLTDAGDLGDRINNLGIGLLELNMPRGRPYISALLPLVRFLRRWRPSVLHTWMYHSDLFWVRSCDHRRTDSRYLVRSSK